VKAAPDAMGCEARPQREDAGGVRRGDRGPSRSFICVDSLGKQKVTRLTMLDPWQSKGRSPRTPARSVPRGLGWRALLEHPDKGSGLEEVHASFSADPLLRHGDVRAVVHLEDVCEVLEVQGSGTPPVRCRMLARVEAVLLRLLPRCGRRSRRAPAPSPASPPRPRPACSGLYSLTHLRKESQVGDETPNEHHNIEANKVFVVGRMR
jgi:hypothetical protein